MCSTTTVPLTLPHSPLTPFAPYPPHRPLLTCDPVKAAKAARLRKEEIAANRTDCLACQRQQRELDTVQSMRLLHGTDLARQPESDLLGGRFPTSYNPHDDEGLKQYRKEAMLSMRQKARELEKRIYFTVSCLWSSKQILFVELCFCSDLTPNIWPLNYWANILNHP